MEADLAVNEMVSYIMSAANEKAENIREEGLEQFEKEKFSIVSAQKGRIREEYAKKVKGVDTRYAIAKSLAINRSRLSKIKERQMMMTRVAEDVKADLRKGSAQNKEYITRLITQCMLILLEDNVKIQCRAADQSLVQSCFPGATDLYVKTVKEQGKATKTCKLELDAAKSLPEESLGGVILHCQEGTIVVDNTIDARLGLVMEQDKPMIRASLFPVR